MYSWLLVTPLQEKPVLEAAVVANDWWMQVPEVTVAGPVGALPVISAEAARTLRLQVLLRRVVTHGTARSAADVPGLDVAGLTGTAPAGGADPRATVASLPRLRVRSRTRLRPSRSSGPTRMAGNGGTVAAPIAGARSCAVGPPTEMPRKNDRTASGRSRTRTWDLFLIREAL